MKHEIFRINSYGDKALVKNLKYLLLFLAAVSVILPIVVVFLGSFKTSEEFNRSKPFALPSFTSNTEIWKGTKNLADGGTLTITKKMLEKHEVRKVTLVVDPIEDKDNAVWISDKSGSIVSRGEGKIGESEITIAIPKGAQKDLAKEGFSISGENATVHRVKVLEGFFLDNYIVAFSKGNMLLGFLNTLILIFFSGIGTVLTGSMTAFVLSRFKFKGKKIVYTAFLWIALIPTITTQVATFQIIYKLGLYNTRLSCIILSMGTDIIGIMIYLQFLNNISNSLDESAIIDGASWWQVFTKIIFPLLQPATVTILILKCINLYNDFYNPLLYMPKQSLMVISTSLYKFKGPFGTNWPVICAGVVIALIPTLITFIVLQRYIYGGMVTGSVKE